MNDVKDELKKINDAKIKKIVGACLKRRREASGYTQDEISEMLGINKASYARYEQGTSEPSITRLAQIADIFQCGLDQLVIDTSVRVEEQTKRIALALENVSIYDRESIIQIVEQACKIARNKSKARKLPDHLR